MKRKNLAGQTFEYWTVQDDYTYENNQGKWLCKCRCGTLKYVNAQNLLSGKSKSCGCLSAALARNRIKDLTGKDIWTFEGHKTSAGKQARACELGLRVLAVRE